MLRIVYRHVHAGKGPGGQVKADELIDKLWGAFSHPPTRIDSLAVHKARLAAKKDCKGDTEEEAAGERTTAHALGLGPVCYNQTLRAMCMQAWLLLCACTADSVHERMGATFESVCNGVSSCVYCSRAGSGSADGLESEGSAPLPPDGPCRKDSLALHRARIAKARQERDGGMGRLSGRQN